MSTIRPRSVPAYLLALPAGLWMFGAVVMPALLIFWVSLWGGTAFGTGNPITTANYERFFGNATYRGLIGYTFLHSFMLMAITGVLGYCIAFFLVMKVTHRGLRTALFLAFIIPFWTSALIRAIAWVPFLGVNGVINQALMGLGITDRPIEVFLYSRTGISMAQVSLYTLMANGPVVYMLAQIPPSLREAAMTLKAPPSVVFWRVIFPLTLPGVVIGQLLVFLSVMADFATVQWIGGNKIALLPNLILNFYEGAQLRGAAVVSVVLMACMLLGTAVAMRVVDIRKLGT